MPRWLVDGERLIIDVVTGVRRGRLEIRLQLERRHLDDCLAFPEPGRRPGTRRRCRRGRTLRYDGLHARRFGSGFARRRTSERLECRCRLFRRWRRRGSRRVDDIAFEDEISPFQLDSLVRGGAYVGDRGLELGHRLEIEIRRIQFLSDRRRLGTVVTPPPEVRDGRLETFQQSTAVAGTPPLMPGTL